MHVGRSVSLSIETIRNGQEVIDRSGFKGFSDLVQEALDYYIEGYFKTFGKLEDE